MILLLYFFSKAHCKKFVNWIFSLFLLFTHVAHPHFKVFLNDYPFAVRKINAGENDKGGKDEVKMYINFLFSFFYSLWFYRKFYIYLLCDLLSLVYS